MRFATQPGTPAASAPKAPASDGHQAVAGEDVGAPLGRHGVGEQRLLDRQEGADVARRRVDRADGGDDQQRAERGHHPEGEPGHDHQHRHQLEEVHAIEAPAPQRRWSG